MKKFLDALPTRQGDAECVADSGFAEQVIRWQKQHGRHVLPWQLTRDPYRIWLSEVMLQQTQVATVIPYYLRFIQRFPDVAALAVAPAEEVMSHWSGLGYYSRARNLHRCAQQVMEQYRGVFPRDPELLAQLPGIGRSTAAAIAAFAYGERAAILDGNVKRVFARVFGIDGYPGAKPVEDRMWQRAVALLPEHGIESYTQGLMDLGATICTRSRPLCPSCPLAERCVALAQGRVHELPLRKPKKAVPEKACVMLVIADGDQVLLQQRPDSGIWGGLLSLPEVDATSGTLIETEIATATSRFGIMASCEPLPGFSHAFTHFKLHVAPYRIRLSRRLAAAAEASCVWMETARLAEGPLPAPVKKLLLKIFCANDLFAD